MATFGTINIGLINPNTNAATTRAMVSIAQRAVPALNIMGLTAQHGPMMIQNRLALDASATEVVRLGQSVQALQGLIVSAFGDPGVAQLSKDNPTPVVGIGGAAARLAARRGGALAVVTTTPKLADQIDMLMQDQCGAARYLGCFLTVGDPEALMQDPEGLDAAMLAEIKRAAEAGASQVIIGGGPLGMAAERLADRSPIPLINPIRAAAYEMEHRLCIVEKAST